MKYILKHLLWLMLIMSSNLLSADPNLKLTQAINSPSIITQGTSVTVSATIKNLGDSWSSKRLRLYIALQSDLSNPILLKTLTSQSLSANQTATFTFSSDCKSDQTEALRKTKNAINKSMVKQKIG